MTATWTQAQIDELKAAIASGVLTVSYSGPPARSVTYQSLKEMRELLAAMLEDSARAAGGRSYVLAGTRKGV